MPRETRALMLRGLCYRALRSFSNLHAKGVSPLYILLPALAYVSKHLGRFFVHVNRSLQSNQMQHLEVDLA
jgi:hypothetical protein